ncbi:hypothetical protein CLU79DRAFT_752529 [Phycomyces nitens]|nr:hypothetical protein CLU79DRAFT_752529 [Phycomyces nitens]
MPFDTIGHSHKRFRAEVSPSSPLDHTWAYQPSPVHLEINKRKELPRHGMNFMPIQSTPQHDEWANQFPTTPLDTFSHPYLHLPTLPSSLDYSSLSSTPIDIPSSYSDHFDMDNMSIEDQLSSPSSNTSSWIERERQFSESSMGTPLFPSYPSMPTLDCNTSHGCCTPSPAPVESPSTLHEHILHNPIAFTDILSSLSFSYTDVGVNMAARVANASDLRSLIDTFGKLCRVTPPDVVHDSHLPPANLADNKSSVLLSRNQNHKSKPVNFFTTVSQLGQQSEPLSKHDDQMSLKQIADACIDTYFSCWIRYMPVINKDEFMAWYTTDKTPLDTLIVNAICSFTFRHVVTQHSTPGLEHFLADQDKLESQEEYFFNHARKCLSQSFDSPDRYTVVALLLMSAFTGQSRRHHYAGMAVSALQELEIYPRMVEDEDDSFAKEMDTRLWWSVWANNFYLYSSGVPKNMPQVKSLGEVDLPRIFEEDIDEAEIGLLANISCLKLWRIQSDMLSTLYEKDEDMQAEKLSEYDRRLEAFYNDLPEYFKFESGFEYGCEDLFLACVQVNIEYNATQIILHKLFIPDASDPSPSPLSLRSLNVCLSAALMQLRTLKTCHQISSGRCAFDRDELWRATEVISLAMSIEQGCRDTADRNRILHGIDRTEYENALTNALEILRETREFKTKSKNWIQVEDWLQEEINRHRLSSTLFGRPPSPPEIPTRPTDYFSASLKSPVAPAALDSPATPFTPVAPPSLKPSRSNSLSGSILSVLSFPTRKSVPVAASKSVSACLSSSFQGAPLHFQNQFGTLSSTPTASSRNPSFSSAPQFVQFNSYSPQPDQAQRTQAKSQARFRYFNPRKMNKFLFIDENPMM